MKPTADFLARAQTCIEAVTREYKPKIMAAYGQVKADHKADKSVVTELDFALEDALKRALGGLDAGIGFEGEEYGAEGNRDTFWLIDPIDGTEYFVRGLPYVRTMVTLIDGGEPVFALLYNPVTDTLFVGSKGRGTTKNGRPAHVSRRPLERMRFDMDGHINNLQTARVAIAVDNLINKVLMKDEFTYVVDGRLDGHLVHNSRGKTWDFAPRALLLAEAGARVANLGSGKYDYRQPDMLATNPEVFDTIMATVVKALNEGKSR